MAHAIFEAEAKRRSLPVAAFSAGVVDYTGALPAKGAWSACLQHGTPISKPGSTFVRDLDSSELVRIFVMEPFHSEMLAELRPDITAPVALLGDFDPKQRGSVIEDPIGQDSAAFEYCYSRLRDCIIQYLETTRDFTAEA